MSVYGVDSSYRIGNGIFIYMCAFDDLQLFIIMTQYNGQNAIDDNGGYDVPTTASENWPFSCDRNLWYEAVDAANIYAYHFVDSSNT